MGGGFGLKGGGVACFCLGFGGGGIADVVGVVEKRTFLGGKGYLLEGVGVRRGGVEGSYDVAEVMAPKIFFVETVLTPLAALWNHLVSF